MLSPGLLDQTLLGHTRLEHAIGLCGSHDPETAGGDLCIGGAPLQIALPAQAGIAQTTTPYAIWQTKRMCSLTPAPPLEL